MESENLLDLSLIDQEVLIGTPEPLKKEINYWGKSYVHDDHGVDAIKEGGISPNLNHNDDNSFPGLELPESGLGLDVITRELAANERIGPLITMTQEEYERHQAWRG